MHRVKLEHNDDCTLDPAILTLRCAARSISMATKEAGGKNGATVRGKRTSSILRSISSSRAVNDSSNALLATRNLSISLQRHTCTCRSSPSVSAVRSAPCFAGCSGCASCALSQPAARHAAIERGRGLCDRRGGRVVRALSGYLIRVAAFRDYRADGRPFEFSTFSAEVVAHLQEGRFGWAAGEIRFT